MIIMILFWRMKMIFERMVLDDAASEAKIDDGDD